VGTRRSSAVEAVRHFLLGLIVGYAYAGHAAFVDCGYAGTNFAFSGPFATTIDPPDESLATLFCYNVEMAALPHRLAAVVPGSWLITMMGLDCLVV